MNITAYTCQTTDRRDSKRAKLCPHLLFPDTDWWLWHDYNMRLSVPAERLFEGHESAELVGFRHRLHDCAYEEHAACARMGKDDIDVMRKQMDGYRKDRFPSHFGLIECGVLLRRNCKAVIAFNEAWYAEVQGGSLRDQLSVGYAAWLTGIEWHIWRGTAWENEFFRIEDNL